jgi:hypothetical protein
MRIRRDATWAPRRSRQQHHPSVGRSPVSVTRAVTVGPTDSDRDSPGGPGPGGRPCAVVNGVGFKLFGST